MKIILFARGKDLTGSSPVLWDWRQIKGLTRLIKSVLFSVVKIL